MSRVVLFGLLGCCCAALAGEAPAAPPVTLTIDFGKELEKARPRTGFLGGLRDEEPDELIQPLNPTLWRIGHQFRGRIKAGLTGAVARVEKLGAKYKLVMSDLIQSQPTDWVKYETDVQKLVKETGTAAATIIWEPVNEPDISHRPIEKYYELYAHAFKALREAEKEAKICGPGFAFPSYEKYRAFLDYCRANKLECNYLAWHYTGWDPHFPEKANWKLGKMREYIAEYPDQKIREVHCDEWGAGPDKPGRLFPGLAIVWFHYLENVYQVDRACRANWGKDDDHLGGIVTPKAQPYPVYHAYRWYAAAKGQTRVATTGNSKTLACLACKSDGRREIVLGSAQKGTQTVVLELKALDMAEYKVEARVLPNAKLDAPLAEADIPACKDLVIAKQPDGVRITLQNVAEHEAYYIVLTR